MTTYGLTSTGFVAKTTTIALAELQAAIQNAFGASVDVSSSALLGQLAAIIAERDGLLWSLAQAVSASIDPDAATGAALDAICALTGVSRPGATSSSVTLTLTGTAAVTVPSGSQVKTASTGMVFATTVAAPLAAPAAWATSTAYAVGARVSTGTAIYQCTVAGTSSVIGSPVGLIFHDGTLTWAYLGSGGYAADVTAVAVLTGPIAAVAGDLTSIVTPFGNWASAVNLLDATKGADAYTDQQLRVLRTASIAALGASTADAIRAALLAVSSVTSAQVFVNNTDVTNSDAMPPHSIEACVLGGADADVAAVLYAQVAAGIAMVNSGSGAVATTVTDSQGVAQPVKFTRPAQQQINVIVTVLKDPLSYPSDGDAQVKNAIVAWGTAQKPGKDVVASAIAAQAFTVAGVLDATALIALNPTTPTVGTTIPISTRQIAMYQVANVTVTSTSGTP